MAKFVVTDELAADRMLVERIASITKKRQTVLKGEPQRLHWSEEAVRWALLQEPNLQ